MKARYELPVLGIEVPVGSIEQELKKLWEADEANTNASMMNLAIYSEDPESLMANSEIIRNLTREHSCRAILIGMDREAEESEIHSWITAHCHLMHGKKSVCCEQLSFLLRGYALGRMRNTVFAHLASDLPLVFWWQGDLSEIFEGGLYRSIDRFVVDSAEWSDPGASYALVRKAVADTGRRLVVQDLSWTRTYHFRLSLAALFDDLMAQRALGEIEEVVIRAQPEHRLASLLLLSWLATQAGWRPGWELERAARHAAGCEECFVFETEGGKNISIRLEWDAEGAPLSLCQITAPGCVVRVSREAGSVHLRQVLECCDHVIDRSGPADGLLSADLVADQLSRGGKNSLFRKVWPVFFDLLGGDL